MYVAVVILSAKVSSDRKSKNQLFNSSVRAINCHADSGNRVKAIGRLMYDPDEIYRFAFRLRTAIESVPANWLPITFSSFPRGACGDASLILGAYLVDNGFHEFVYVVGERGAHDAGTWSSHAWLEAGSLVADITADQFQDAPSKVVVVAPSPWHQCFTVVERQSADFRSWSGFGILHLHTLYSRLKDCL